LRKIAYVHTFTKTKKDVISCKTFNPRSTNKREGKAFTTALNNNYDPKGWNI
jgi:hypothetical protein